MDYLSSLDDILNMIDKLVGIAEKVIPLIVTVASYHRIKKEDSLKPGKHTNES